MTRTDIINAVMPPGGAYLEIGIYAPARNFDLIRGAAVKVGVDTRPMHPAEEDGVEIYMNQETSDDFFATKSGKFDVIFLDGDHRFPQCRTDLLNALKLLNTGGLVVMHDCLPQSREAVLPEKPAGGRAWNGEVWKAWRYVRSRKDLLSFVVDCDHGCGVVKRGRRKSAIEDSDRYTWENAKDWAGIVSPESFAKDNPRLGSF